MKTLLIALLTLSVTGCANELIDVVTGPGSDDDTDTDPGSDDGSGAPDAPEACVVGDWYVTGDTGIGDCYTLFGIIIEHGVRFEQDGDDVSATLIQGYSDDVLASAGYDESPNGCSAGFHIASTDTEFDIHYAVSVDSGGNVFGTAVLAANIDGYQCEQAWEVVGVLDESAL